jgi:quinoprotein glucose dehydrogenase
VERGTVRAFDVRTGKMRWSFDPLGRTDVTRSGAANAWAVMAADEKRGLVFIPTSSPSPDYFGGLRAGANAFANSVVAIEAASGRVVWHFQVVHHDLWDYDVAAQPNLITFRKGERDVDAIAITTKMGNLFILDRVSGKPLLGVEERAVAPSDIPGEVASATQPYTSNPPLVPQGPIRPDDAWGPSPEEREWCRSYIARFKSGGIFTPPTVQGTIVNPGNAGGVAWGGASWDPRRRRLFVNTNRLPFVVRLIPRGEFDAERQRARDNRMEGEFATQRGAPFGMFRTPLFGPSRLPCIAPPWGMLAAIDTDTGAKIWEVPLGKLGAADVKGLPSFGGSLITAADLLFIAATIGEDALRAFDSSNGELLWQVALPAGGQATPVTYRVDGRQYVVLAAGGHGKANTKRGDYVVAYALP